MSLIPFFSVISSLSSFYFKVERKKEREDNREEERNTARNQDQDFASSSVNRDLIDNELASHILYLASVPSSGIFHPSS